MLRVIDILAPGGFVAADHVTLDQDQRHRRRLAMVSAQGVRFLLDEAATVRLRHGQGLKLEGGAVVEVRAAPEALLEVRASGPSHLLKLAWHIGNRHLAAEVHGDRLLIRYDHVIAHMLEHLGATVRRVEASFDPEGGAYGDTHLDHHHHEHHADGRHDHQAHDDHHDH
jgi:urease accessory protein